MTIGARVGARRLVTGLALAISIILLMPFEPSFVPSDSTGGWSTRLAADLAEGRRFGVDTLFTYGPLGIVPTRAYHPGTFATLLFGSAIVAFAFVSASMRVFTRCGLTWRSASLLTLLVTATVTSQLNRVGTEPIFNLLIAFVPLLAAVGGGERERLPLELLLGIALAVAGLGKFNYLVGAAGVVAIVSALDLRARRVPAFGIAFALSVPSLWLLFGQRLGDLRPYLVSSLDITSGYTEAMSLESQPRDAVGFVIVAILLALATLAFRSSRREKLDELGVLLCWAGWLFIVMKTAVVRQDEHVLSASVTILATGVVLAAIVREDTRALRLTALSTIVLAVIGSLIALVALDATPSIELMRPIHTVRAQAAAISRSVVDPSWRDRRHEANLASVRAMTPLPPLSGSVDFMPSSSTVPWAHGFSRKPNPVVMSYIAPYSPDLAEAQAAHLRAVDGPRNLFVRLETIDDRYPSLDFGPSLLEMLSAYAVAGRAGEDLLLSRRERPRRLSLEAIGRRQAKVGESIDIATLAAGRGPVWVRIRAEGGIHGALVSALYRSSTFYIRATTADGSVRVNRYIPRGGEAGFLLSPYLDSRDSLEALLEGAGTRAGPISAFSIDAGPSALPSMQSITVELFAIRVGQ